MVSLLATVTFMFSSCDNDDSSDTIKPLIELHEPEEDFSFNRSYDVSGQKTAHIHHHDIVIPANATAGDYHLMVYCTDAAGNESYIARNIKLSNEVEDEDHHHNE